MRCLSCSSLSIFPLCKNCRDTFLKPTIKRDIVDGLEIYSFYRYSSIEPLLLLKYRPEGYRVLKALAKMTFREFIREFRDDEKIYIIGIDERVRDGYSHIAVMTHQMSMRGVEVLHSSLLARNRVKYAGESLKFRQENPREFIYSGKIRDISVILVDDIKTTGTTLLEARDRLLEYNIRVEFALVLADV